MSQADRDLIRAARRTKANAGGSPNAETSADGKDRADFLTHLRNSNLLDDAALGEIENDSTLPADARGLAAKLTQRGLLTSWQAQRLLAGGSGFFFGKYKLLSPLGHGGMGTVFKAEQQPLGRVVAIKVMAKELVKDPDAVARFRREIQAAAALSDPHIVHAFDADSVKDSHFLVMEFVDGDDLSDIVKQAGPLPVGTACEYIRQAALGLQHAHERQMIHRDIKPSNLLVTQQNGQPVVKILDFGLAKFRSEKVEAGHVTRTGQIMGTPDYIAPEQAANTKSADIRSDIYSLGCTLYRLLTGNIPFPGDNVMEKLMARMTTDPAPPSSQRDDVPPELEAVLNRMLAREADARYQTPAEVAAALAPFAQYSGGDEDTMALTGSLLATTEETQLTDAGYREFMNNLATEIAHEPLVVRPREPVSLGKSLGDRKTVLSVIGAAAVLVAIGILVAFMLPDRNGKADPSDDGDGGDRKNAVAANDEANSDRATAEWLRKEFRDVQMGVYLHGREELKQFVNYDRPLPKEPFRIRRVNLKTIRRIERADLERLAKLSHLRDLSFNALGNNDLDYSALLVLKELTRLGFQFGYLDDTAFPFIAKLSQLEELALNADRGRITQKGLNQLSRLRHLKKLFFMRVPLAGMRFDFLNSITGPIQLHIAHGGLRDDDFKNISQVASIHRLELEHDHFTDEGLFHLRDMPNLNSIGMRQLPKITPRCLRHFETFPKLRVISIKAKNVSTADLQRFKVRHPDWSVAHGLGKLQYDPKLLYPGRWYDLTPLFGYVKMSTDGLEPKTGVRPAAVEVSGSYRLHVALTRGKFSREKPPNFSIKLPFSTGEFSLHAHIHGTYLAHTTKEKDGPGQQKTLTNTNIVVPAEKRSDLVFEVRPRGQRAKVTVQLNGRSLLEWEGIPRESPVQFHRKPALVYYKRGKVTWHSIRLQPLDQPARIPRPLKGPRFKTARDLVVPDWAVERKPVRTITAGEMIDLVPYVDPWEDSVQGNWGFRDGKLMSLGGRPHQFHVFAPVDIHGDYDLEVIAGGQYSDNGHNWMSLVLPAGNRVFRVHQEVYGKRLSGLDYVKGKDIIENGLGTADDIVQLGDKSVIRVKVRTRGTNSTITATINGRKIIDWTGPTDDLAWKDQYWWRWKPAFFSFRPGLEIASAKLTMVSGEAKLYRDRPPITAPRGQRQYALSFDGKDDYVEIPSLKYDDGPVTIEAVVSSPGDQGPPIVVVEGKRSVLSIWDSTGRRPGGGTTGISRFDGKTEFVARTDIGTHLNRTHLAAVYDGKRVSFYINGVKTTNSNNFARPIKIDGKPKFQLGKSLPGRFFQGRIEELRVSKGARYTDKFVATKQLEKDAATLALYHFDEGQDDVLTDHSGNAHHGKIHGATWVNADGTPAEPPRDYALSFDGDRNSVLIPDLAPSAKDTVTIEAWVRLKSFKQKSSHQTMLRFGHLQLGLYNLNKRWQAAARLRRQGRHSSSFAKLNHSAKLGERTHLACVATSTSLTLFVNGKQVDRVEIAAGAEPSPFLRQTLLGRSGQSPSGRPFHGDLDEVRISAGKRYVKDFTPAKRFTPGKDDLVEIPSLAPTGKDPITFEAWVRLKGKTVGRHQTVGKLGFLSLQHWNPAMRWQATARMMLNGKERHSGPRKAESAKIGKRVHLATVWTPTSMSLFIDGSLVEQNKIPANATPRKEEAYSILGHATRARFVTGNLGLHGDLDEVRISKVARYTKDFTPAKRFTPDKDTLALYHFDEGTGDVLKDHSGNGHHGKIHGATWVNADGSPIQAKKDFALSFDGKDDLVEIPSLAPSGEPVTFEAWVRLTGENAKRHQTVAFYGSLSLHRFNPQMRWQTMASTLLNGQGRGFSSASRGNSAMIGRRVHLAGVWTPTSISLFIDGKLAERKEIPGKAKLRNEERYTILGNHKPFRWVKDSNRSFRGVLDEVRFSKGIRYKDDFKPAKRFTPDKNTLALYHFDEGTGDVLTDHSGNGHHGKIHGATWVNADGSPIQPEKKFALSFDGKDDYVDISALHFDARKPFTIEAWIDPVIASQRHIPVSILGPNGGGYLMNMGGGPNGIFYYGGLWSDRNGSHAGTGPKGLTHVAMVSSPRGLALFINGKKSSTPPKTQDRSAKFKTPQSYIGVRRDFFTDNRFEHWFKGTIHAVRVSSVARYADNFQPSRRFTPDKDTLALYRFDEGTGDVLKDHSGNKHHGKIHGATWVNTDGSPIQPKKKFALSFDGKDDYVEIPSLTPSGKEPFTIEAWARVKGVTGNSAWQNAIRFGFFQLRFHQRNRTWTASSMMSRGGKPFWPFAKDKNAVPIGKRMHLAAVWTPAEISLFVNGRLVGKNPIQAGVTPDLKSQKFVLGRWVPAGQPGSANGFRGDLLQVRISQGKRYLNDFTPEERFTPDTETLALYRFDRGFGTHLKDFSGKNHHGMIHGATWVNANGTPLGSDGVLWNGYEHDILSMITPPKGWTKTKEGLKAKVPKRNATVEIPIACRQDYRWHVYFKRMTGGNSVNLLFPVGPRVCQVIFDGYDKHLCTLGPIGGKQGADSPVSSAGIELKNGRAYRAVVDVRLDGEQATILVNLNSKPELNLKWSGPLSDLAESHKSGRFNVSSWDGGVLISKMTLRPFSGPARLTRPLPGSRMPIHGKTTPKSQPSPK